MSNCKHDGPHNVGWYLRSGTESDPDYRIADAIKQAMHHAFPDELEPGDVDTMHRLLGRIDRDLYPASREHNVPFWVTDEDLVVIKRVMYEVCNYMEICDYDSEADEESFPEDVRCARTLRDSSIAWVCWVDPDAAAAKARALNAERTVTK